MKKYFKIIVLFCLVVSSTEVFSQPRNPREAKRVTNRMSEDLNLSPEQYKKVIEINLAAAEKVRTALEQTPDPMVLKQKLITIREEIDISLLEILSTAQWKNWIDLDKELNDQEDL